MPLHEQIDLDSLIQRFPLDPSSPPSWGDLHGVVRLERLALYIQVHSIITDTPHLPAGVPTDVCCWIDGEPRRRDITKTGGLPYMPRELPWPTYQDSPLRFYAQFCFADSKDIVGKLPDDVLLIFGTDPDDYPDGFVYRWLPLGLTDLVTSADIPANAQSFLPCYASILRATDYNTSRPLTRNTTEEDGLDFDRTSYPAYFHGTKIGGISTYVVGDYGDEDSEVELEPEPEWGRLLCQLDTIGGQPADDSPLRDFMKDDREADFASGFLEMFASGTLYLYLDPDNNIHQEFYFS